MERDRGPWIQTMDGDALYLLDPDPECIRIDTLAIVLSRICRFGGHTRRFYSVAEHSLRVWRYVADRHAPPDLQLAALLHDAHEAYSGFGDVCRPARELAPEIERVQALLDAVIARKYGFDPVLFSSPLVRLADTVLLSTEARDVMRAAPQSWGELPDPLPEKIFPSSPSYAAWQFESQAQELIYECNQLSQED